MVKIYAENVSDSLNDHFNNSNLLLVLHILILIVISYLII